MCCWYPGIKDQPHQGEVCSLNVFILEENGKGKMNTFLRTWWGKNYKHEEAKDGSSHTFPGNYLNWCERGSFTMGLGWREIHNSIFCSQTLFQAVEGHEWNIHPLNEHVVPEDSHVLSRIKIVAERMEKSIKCVKQRNKNFVLQSRADFKFLL